MVRGPTFTMEQFTNLSGSQESAVAHIRVPFGPENFGFLAPIAAGEGNCFFHGNENDACKGLSKGTPVEYWYAWSHLKQRYQAFCFKSAWSPFWIICFSYTD